MAAPVSSQDQAGERALSGAVDRMMAAATAEKPSATVTGLTLSVDAADRKALSRPQVAALNRAQTVLAGPFDVTVSYGEPGEESDETQPAEPAQT